MTGSGTDSGIGVWRAPECPYTIEYSERVMDDIRLSVVDAFFSLPRGGAEIGGVLLGTFANAKITILDYEQLDCEHAMGPSFTLSARDQSLLSEIVLRKKNDGLRVVGWYHSHTRSEIFLSDIDLDIHKRFFRDIWQIALVLKPHIFEPTRGGFFFREPDGSVRSAASYQEFVLEPLPVRPMPGAPPAVDAPPQPLRKRPDPQGPILNLTAEPDVKEVAAAPAEAAVEAPPRSREPLRTPEPFRTKEPEPVREPAAANVPRVVNDVPTFLQVAPERNWRWLKVAVSLLVIGGAGAFGYQTRDKWVPVVRVKAAPMIAKIQPALPKPPAPSIALAASADENGQVLIRWDRNSPSVQQATGGTLLITDGDGPQQTMKLDAAHVQAGTFTYGREKENVDVTLTVEQAGGGQVKDVTVFHGKIQAPKVVPEDPQVRKERDTLRDEATKLRTDLGTQQSRTRKLEKDVNDLKDQLAKEQKRRMGNQLTETPGKQK